MISILKNSVLLFKQQLKGQLYTGRNISVVKSVLMSRVLASSAVGKQQAQAKSVSSFLFAERSICYGGMAVLRRDTLGCSLLFATSPALLPWRQRRNRRSAQCVTVGRGATKIWAVHGAVILQRVQVALVSAASCRGNNDVGSP